MLIRLATVADAAAIACVHIETWQAAYRGLMPDALLDGLQVANRVESWTQILQKNESKTFIAVLDNKIAGFCSLLPSRDADSDKRCVGEIAAIYVSPRYWRKGVGRMLCDTVVEAARGDGYRNVTLWVLKSNAPAQEFYRQLGFASDGAEKSLDFGGTQLQEVRYRLIFLGDQ